MSNDRLAKLLGGYAVLGYIFLYLPIVMVVIYSFSASRLGGVLSMNTAVSCW